MTKQEQQAVFGLQLFLPYELKGNEGHRTETISLPATKEQLEQLKGGYLPDMSIQIGGMS